MGSTCPANWTTYPLPFFLSKSRFDSVSLVYDEALHMLWAILRFGTSANQTLFLVSLSVYGGLLAPPMAINASYVGNTKSCNLSTSTCQGCSRCIDEISYNCGSSRPIRCSKCLSCASNQYQSVTCSNQNDTECRNCSTCSAESVISSACSKLTNTQCKLNQVLIFYQMIVGGDGDLTIEAMIAYLSEQGLSTFIPAVENFDKNMDAEISVSEFSNFEQYWWFGKDVTSLCTCSEGRFARYNCSETHHNASCEICSSCTAGRFEAVACGRTVDTTCSLCSQCESGFFTFQSCSNESDVVCSACTICTKGRYALEPCTNVTDTICDVSKPSEVVFSVVMPQSEAQFEEDENGYIVSMGETLFKKATMETFPNYDTWTEEEKFVYYNKSVHVTSIQAVTVRRRLLATGCNVGTAILVEGDGAAADVKGLVTSGNFLSILNSNLESNGLPAAQGVSAPQVEVLNAVTTPAPSTLSNSFPAAIVIGSAVGGLTLLLLIGISAVFLLRPRYVSIDAKDQKVGAKAEVVFEVGEEIQRQNKDGLTMSEGYGQHAQLIDCEELLASLQDPNVRFSDEIERQHDENEDKEDLWEGVLCNNNVMQYQRSLEAEPEEGWFLQPLVQGFAAIASWFTPALLKEQEHPKDAHGTVLPV